MDGPAASQRLRWRGAHVHRRLQVFPEATAKSQPDARARAHHAPLCRHVHGRCPPMHGVMEPWRAPSGASPGSCSYAAPPHPGSNRRTVPRVSHSCVQAMQSSSCPRCGSQCVELTTVLVATLQHTPELCTMAWSARGPASRQQGVSRKHTCFFACPALRAGALARPCTACGV